MKLEVTTESVEQTALLAGVIARKLRGGEAIELIGDVGAGKTTFVGALVAALESDDHVSSPTFAISNVYDSGRLPVYHFDFYRLGDNDALIRHELAEAVSHEGSVIVMEWAQEMHSVLERTPIQIAIVAPSEIVRTFTLTVPSHYAYVGAS